VLPAFAEKVVAGVRRPALPHVCCSVKPARALLDRSSFALVAAGMLLGAAAAALIARRK
jgi:hypothetical protein